MGFRIGVILLVISWLAVLGESSILPHNSFIIATSSSFKKVGECVLAENEMSMDSEVSRRLVEENEMSMDSEVSRRLVEENEMSMDSDVSRRLVAENTRHISYDALKKDEVPCNRKGQSYYNCTKMKKANPYQRGCSTITHCKRYTG